jgi:SAM-dependent methyltransferase
LLDGLLNGTLRCPACRGALQGTSDEVRCGNCGVGFPVTRGVLNLLVGWQPAPDVGTNVDELAAAIARQLDLADDPGARGEIAQILADSGRLPGQDALSAEMADVADRFGAASDAMQTHPVWTLAERSTLNLAPELRIDRHYLPREVRPGEHMVGNVRITNVGRNVVSSRTDQPLAMSYRWHATDGTVTEGPRTPFPIDVVPGRAITLPLRITTPAKAGRYLIEVVPVHEQVRWLDECSLRVDVVVSDESVTADIDVVRSAEVLDYAEDHALSMQLVRPFLEGGSSDRPRLLEVGGGPHPQLAWAAADVVNVDISPVLLQLGSLFFGQRYDEQMLFIAADATELPFDDDSFDGIAMFATLHHFAAPERLLAECRRVCRPTGFVAVMSEPVAGDLDGPETVRDLLKGINEQCFTTDEYLRIAASSGLAPLVAQVDGGSFKAVFRSA